MKGLLLSVCCGLLWWIGGCGSVCAQVSETRYDYSDVSRSITQGCRNKYEQAHAIYRWLCDNIAYDTSYSIYTADECWDQKKGVCQAYSELFYRLAEPVGLDVRIISGVSKDREGKVDPQGHAWVCAVMEDNVGVLIDATWGAGYVENGRFTHRPNNESWFDVDPYWMIFTHYPKEDCYQLLPEQISQETFLTLPPLRPVCGAYGWDGRQVLQGVLEQKISLPEIYEHFEQDLRFVDIPMQAKLRIGQWYTFRLKKKSDCRLALINKDFYMEDVWQHADGEYWLKFMPVEPGEVQISLSKGTKTYHTVVNYEVLPPTAADWKQVERYRPYALPKIREIGNLKENQMLKHGVDGHRFLQLYREGKVGSSMPTFYTNPDVDYQIVDVPFKKKLQMGQSYTFSVRSSAGVSWAVINGSAWFREWQISEDGTRTITVVPVQAGPLRLSVQLQEGGSFHACLGYEVE